MTERSIQPSSIKGFVERSVQLSRMAIVTVGRARVESGH